MTFAPPRRDGRAATRGASDRRAGPNRDPGVGAEPPAFQAARQTWSDGVHPSDSRGIATFRPERVGGSEECPVAAPILPFPVIALASGATSSNRRITKGIPGYLVTGLASCDQIRHRVRRTCVPRADPVCAHQSAPRRPRRGMRCPGRRRVDSRVAGYRSHRQKQRPAPDCDERGRGRPKSVAGG